MMGGLSGIVGLMGYETMEAYLDGTAGCDWGDDNVGGEEPRVIVTGGVVTGQVYLGMW